MKYRHIILTAAAAWMGMLPSAFAQGNSTLPATCEYWFDHDFNGRSSSSIPADGNWSQEFSMAQFTPGIHVLGLRVSDSQGRWGFPLIRHFYVKGEVPTMEGNVTSKLEYWIDYDFANRKKDEIKDDAVEMTLDLQNLHEGIHTISYRVGDNYGYWTQPVVRNFIRTATHEPIQNSLGKLTYWIDYDYNNAKTANATDGSFDLELDMSSLSRGLHTFSYYVGDELKKNSAPVTRYFVIPELAELSGDKISAYEYWFNHGPRKHVDVDPQNPLELKDVYINIEDVVPNSIASDYSFDPVTLGVSTDDNVFFGIQAFDNAGHATSAILSDTFAIKVNVQPEYINLENNVPAEFSRPETGHIQGFKFESESNDSLEFTVDGNCKFDIYASDGKKLVATKNVNTDGKTLYGVKAPTTITYALLYDSYVKEEKQQVVCQRFISSGIHNTLANLGLSITTEQGKIIIDASQTNRVRISSTGGVVVFNKNVTPGITSIPVHAGVYMISTSSGESMKVIVK